MFHAGTPHHWFEEAILHAIFILNRVPCSSIDFKTSIELWRGGWKPDLSKIRVFGCLGYKYEEDYKNKLDLRSEPMIVVRNTDTGYLMKNLTTGVVDEYRNVLIDKNRLFKDLSKSNTPLFEPSRCNCIFQDSGDEGEEAVVKMAEVFEAEAINAPATYEDVMKTEDRLFWEDTVCRELETMEENNIYEIIHGKNFPNVVDT